MAESAESATPPLATIDLVRHDGGRGSDISEPKLTVNEVAATLQIPARTVRSWVQSGRLQAVKLGGKWYVYARVLREFVAEGGR